VLLNRHIIRSSSCSFPPSRQPLHSGVPLWCAINSHLSISPPSAHPNCHPCPLKRLVKLLKFTPPPIARFGQRLRDFILRNHVLEHSAEPLENSWRKSRSSRVSAFTTPHPVNCESYRSLRCPVRLTSRPRDLGFGLTHSTMPGLFAKVFRGRDGAGTSKSKRNASQLDVNKAPAKPTRWDDAWTRKSVDPEEVQELLRGCTAEIKSRGAYMPRRHKCSDLSCSLGWIDLVEECTG
jgi:hypothetical protein